MLRFIHRELRIELHPQGCTISRPARWISTRRRDEPLASGSGRGVQALEQALNNLRHASSSGLQIGRPLPWRARLVVSDEFVRYDLLPGRDLPQVTLEQAQRRAEHRFADRLGHEESVVSVVRLPGTSDWLCAAIDQDELHAWQDVLRLHGVELAHVHPALVEDLRSVAARVSEPDAVLAFVRDEGMSLVRLANGLPARLHWETLNTDETAIIDWRLRAFAARTAVTSAAPTRTHTARRRAPDVPTRKTVVYLVSRSAAVCRFVLESEAPALPHLPSVHLLAA
jgi:hypothetical protein